MIRKNVKRKYGAEARAVDLRFTRSAARFLIPSENIKRNCLQQTEETVIRCAIILLRQSAMVVSALTTGQAVRFGPEVRATGCAQEQCKQHRSLSPGIHDQLSAIARSKSNDPETLRD